MTKLSYIFRAYIIAYLSADLLFRFYCIAKDLATEPRMIDGEYVKVHDWVSLNPIFSLVIIPFVLPMSIGIFIAFTGHVLLFGKSSFLKAWIVAFIYSFFVLIFLVLSFGGEMSIPYIFNLVASAIVASFICLLGSWCSLINKPDFRIWNNAKETTH